MAEGKIDVPPKKKKIAEAVDNAVSDIPRPEVISAPTQSGTVADPDVFRSNRKNIQNAEIVPDSPFTPMQMAEIDRIKTQLHELDSKAAIRELTTDEFADRANFELDLEDIYGPSKEQQESVSFEDRKKYLGNRNNELGTKAKEYGIKFAKFIGAQADKYNKMPWYKKLAITGSLMAGVSFTSTLLPFISGTLGTVLLGQRALGSIGFAMNRRKAIDAKIAANSGHRYAKYSESQKNIIATLQAAIYMELTSLATLGGIVALNELGVKDWLGNMLGHTTSQQTSGTIPVPTATVPQEGAFQAPLTEATAASSVAPEAAVPAAVEQMTPSESREALRGAVEKITKLTENASAKFEMPKHADFSIHEDDTTISPYDVTPTDQSGAEDILSPEIEEVEEQVETSSASAPETPPVEALPVEKTPEPVVYPKVEADVLQTAENIGAKAEFTVKPVEDARPGTNPDFPLRPIDSVEPPVQFEHVKEFINPNKVPINPLQGHVFVDSSGAVLAYGNDYAARFNAAQDFAKANPNTSVWVQAEKPVFYEESWRPWVFEVKYGGFWRGMQVLGANGPPDPSSIGGINPDTFIKQLDK
jgi:hypothetical protein